MVSLALILVIFAFIGYAMTISNFEFLHVAGLIIAGTCLLAFIAVFILYCVFHKENKDERKDK